MAVSLDVAGLPDNVTVAYGGVVQAAGGRLAVVDVSLPVSPQGGEPDVQAGLPEGSNVILTGSGMELRIPWSKVKVDDGSLDEDALADYAAEAVTTFAWVHGEMGNPGEGFDNAAENAAGNRQGVKPSSPGNSGGA